ncbi:hypothetical protein L0O74_13435, partial [Bifidobacterium longum]|nr:hypothetical protein [Bifidobacterium longum]
MLNDKPIKLQVKQQQQPLPLQALEFPKQRFYPRSKTSFSALAQHLTRKQAIDALAVNTEQMLSAADEIHVIE